MGIYRTIMRRVLVEVHQAECHHQRKDPHHTHDDEERMPIDTIGWDKPEDQPQEATKFYHGCQELEDENVFFRFGNSIDPTIIGMRLGFDVISEQTEQRKEDVLEVAFVLVMDFV